MFLWFRTTPRTLLNLSSALAIATLAACGGDDSNSSPGPVEALPTPSPSPSSPPVQYSATPVPFGLTEDSTFNVFGWDNWPASPVPSVMQLRWNAKAMEYELSRTSASDFARMRLRSESKSLYDVFALDGSQLPFWVDLRASEAPHAVGNARIFEDSKATAYVAFGIATAVSDIPTAGISTCKFGEDEIGDGTIIFDFTAGTASGEVSPFWESGGKPAAYTALTKVEYAPSELPVLSASFGSDPSNLIEARFYGPQASEIAVRAKGEVSGIMTGTCSN